jgi:hypothetical protein
LSFLLAGVVLLGTGGALALGRWLGVRRDGKPVDAPEAGGSPKEAKAEEPSLEGFPCQLGDVVMRITGEEAWLSGAIVLSEELPLAALFVAPEAGQDRALFVTSRARDRITWLDPLDPSAVLVGGEPPHAVEHGGHRFERARRLPLNARRIGAGAPDVGDAVVVAEYVSSGAERLIVLKANNGNVFAWHGTELEAGAFEVIASGATTLKA